jgi:SAM-dependent methyltransferase
VSSGQWEWDETLYAGSAAFYSTGRLAYPPELADAVRALLGPAGPGEPAGRGRLLDVGCGPGSLTLVLAGLFDEAVGIDADADMVARAEVEARAAGVHNVRWHRLRAEDLPAGLGRFRAVSFAQSFHWLDRPRVAGLVAEMLDPGGVCLQIGATTHQGVPGDDPLPHPRPPRPQIQALIAAYLGPVRRAGQGQLPAGTASGEDEVFRSAGFRGPDRIELWGGTVVERTADEIVASVFSLSSAAPHLFADRLPGFERDLRRLLADTSPAGLFSERTREIAVNAWRR